MPTNDYIEAAASADRGERSTYDGTELVTSGPLLPPVLDERGTSADERVDTSSLLVTQPSRKTGKPDDHIIQTDQANTDIGEEPPSVEERVVIDMQR